MMDEPPFFPVLSLPAGLVADIQRMNPWWSGKPQRPLPATSRGNPKICLADHALRASWLQEPLPLDPVGLEKPPALTTEAGPLAESVVGATLSSIPGLDVAHLPARSGDPEIDFVLSVGTFKIPMEIKYERRIDPLRDTEALRTFIERAVNRAPFGLLVTQVDNNAVHDPRIVVVPLSSMMLLR